MHSCEELYNKCSKYDIHFCVLVLNNGLMSSYWAERYDFIPFDKYVLDMRWDKADRICTPWEIQKGKLKHVGYNFINMYKQFAFLIHRQVKRNRAKRGGYNMNREDILEALEIVKPGLASKEHIEQSTCFAFKNGKVMTFNDEISVSHPVEGLDGLEGAIKRLTSFIRYCAK